MSINVAGDVECFGVSNNFICGCWMYRNKKGFLETYSTTEKAEYEQWIIDFAKKQNTMIHARFHNLGYDFWHFANIENRLSGRTNPKTGQKITEGYKLVSLTRHLMVSYLDENGKEIIRFLDTFYLINKSLKEIGLILGYEKLEPREELQAKYKQDKEIELTWGEKQELIKYCERDTEICLRIVEFIKERLEEENYRPHFITTIGSLAIGLFNKRIKAMGMKGIMFEWKENKHDKNKYDEYHMTQYPETIRRAYKVGRIEAFQTGDFENTTNIDKKSCFPKAMTEMPFPNIKKETQITKPLETFKEKELLNTIGVSTCTVECPDIELGYLPLRIKFGQKRNKENAGDDTFIDETIFPDHKCEMEGTWTNYELQKATELGYKITDIEESIIYRPLIEEESPLKRFIQECYDKRKNGHLENHFYKYIMNNLHGKFAQRIPEGEYEISDVSDSIKEEFIQQGYQIKARFGFNYVYVKETGKQYARNFAPILSALTTAYAREGMYKDLLKIPKQDRLYIGTDGILFTGNHLNKFDIGMEMGQYQIIKKGEELLQNVPARIWGKNNYQVGKDIRISGVNKEITKNMKKEEFNKPFKYWKFPTINKANTIEEMFMRKWEEKDLEGIKTKTEGLREYIKTQPKLKDAYTTKDGD